jgi:hypothetical protein
LLILNLWQTNCLTEIFFDNATEREKKLGLEYHPKSCGKALPPLFGLPISLKDSFQVCGYDTSTGLGCYVGKPAEDNSARAAMLIDLGAVLYCKTNLPQSIMTGDSDNNVFGRTLNLATSFSLRVEVQEAKAPSLLFEAAFSELGRILVAAFVSHQSAMESMDSGLA